MWSKVETWFHDVKQRNELLKDFNFAAREAFINKETSCLLEAKTTVGSSEFKHSFSKFMAGGFRVSAYSGEILRTVDIMHIGNGIVQNELLVRRLISLGWDTLEVHDKRGEDAAKWQLSQYLKTEYNVSKIFE